MLEKTIKHHKKIMWTLVIASIVMLFFSPINELKETVGDALPWVLTGVAITESLFVIGIIIMAISVEYELGLNPLKWRSHIKNVLHHVPENKLFWVGFWINAIGAFGSGVVVAAGIIISLPATSWGLIWLPFLDLGLTVALRVTILELKKETAVEET